MKIYIIFYFILLSCLFSCSSYCPGSSCEEISGFWAGEIHIAETGRNEQVILHIQPENNRLKACLDIPVFENIGIPVNRIRYYNGQLDVLIDSTAAINIKIKFKGRLDSEKSCLIGNGNVNGQEYSIIFSKTEEERLAYRIPRIDPDGNRITAYAYSEPEPCKAFKTESINDAGIDSAGISKLIDRILSKHYTDIHSLVILKTADLCLKNIFMALTETENTRSHQLQKVLPHYCLVLRLTKK